MDKWAGKKSLSRLSRCHTLVPDATTECLMREHELREVEKSNSRQQTSGWEKVTSKHVFR